jgi:hypothetical protein
MRVGGARGAPPPSQTGQADLPHPAFQSTVSDGLAQVAVPRCSEGTRQPRSSCGPAHPVTGGPLPADQLQPSGFPPRRRAQPCGTTPALVRWPRFGSQHCLPTSLRSTIMTRFFATTDALTPTGPFVIARRGSLIHVPQLPTILSPTLCGPRPDALHSLNAGRSIGFGLHPAIGGLPRPPTESSSLCSSSWKNGVTDWWFTSSCSPPGSIAPMQLLSVTGPTVSARSGTFTLLFQDALRRTAARPQARLFKSAHPGRSEPLAPRVAST